MAQLVPYRPQALRSVFGLGREFERTLDHLFDNAWQGEDVSGQGWVPRADVRQTDEAIEVRMDLPGMSKDEVDIRIEGNVLIVMGERKLDRGEEGNTWYLQERAFGKFERSFSLSMELDPARADATYRDGVLHVSIPKAETAKPRRLEIKAG